MTLKDWQARWGHHVPAQALAELLGILSPVMPLPAPKARHSEALEELTVYRGSDARPRAMFEDGRFTPEEDGT